MDNAVNIIFFDEYFVCTWWLDNKIQVIDLGNKGGKNWLYFYVGKADIINDLEAKKKFYEKDENTYSFYNTILQLGDKGIKGPKDLITNLIRNLEEIYFEGKPAANRGDKIPLNICFVPGIAETIKKTIIICFNSENFSINSNVKYLKSLQVALQLKAGLEKNSPFAIVESHFGNIKFHYSNERGVISSKELLDTEKWEDNLIRTLATMMVDYVIEKGGGDYDKAVMYDDDIKECIPVAREQLNNFKGNRELIVPLNSVILSNNTSKQITIYKKDLDEKRKDFFRKVGDEFIAFINGHRYQKIFLCGEFIESANFVSIIKYELQGDKKDIVDNIPADEVVKLISSGISILAGTPKSKVDPNPETTYISEPLPPAAPEVKIIVNDPDPNIDVASPEPPEHEEIENPPETTIVPDVASAITAKHETWVAIKKTYSTWIKNARKYWRQLLIPVISIIILFWVVKPTGPAPPPTVDGKTLFRLSKSYYAQGQYPEAQRSFRLLSTTDKQYYDDSLYNSGNTFYGQQNYKEALTSFNESALITGNSKSQCMLGDMYFQGQGVDAPNDSLAITFYQKSSDQHNEEAQLKLALLYAGLLELNGNKVNDTLKSTGDARRILKSIIDSSKNKKYVKEAQAAKLKIDSSIFK